MKAALYAPLLTILVSGLLPACQQSGAESRPSAPAPDAGAALPIPEDASTATFAGGCFWCMEPPYEGLPGVFSVVSGYAGGEEENPRYERVARGLTGHTESVQIRFDPTVISYRELVEIFWRSMDPTDGGGQFADRGKQYRPEIFVHDAAQRAAAETSKRALAESGVFGDEEIVVPITDFSTFYPAEEYHQDYYRKKSAHYKSYRRGSGREGFLQRTWQGRSKPLAQRLRDFEKPGETVLRGELSPLQFKVTQEDATERAFENEFWDNKEAGIYVDVVSGEPLFSSTHKFKSGTGWPSFDRPLVAGFVVEKVDDSYGMRRVEVRSRIGDSHLGHVFDDGPEPTGLRYCINSASLRFVPVAELEQQGYGSYRQLFAGSK